MKKSLTVKCPGCGDEVVWESTSEFRPFCSARCKNLDFIGWAKEEKRLPSDADYDDLLSDSFLSEDAPLRE